ncbi:MAG: DUF397 domain-containing protein [Streptosporangiales bacterium]
MRGSCVFCRYRPGVRDSKNRDGGILSFPSTSWRDFVGAVNEAPGR